MMKSMRKPPRSAELGRNQTMAIFHSSIIPQKKWSAEQRQHPESIMAFGHITALGRMHVMPFGHIVTFGHITAFGRQWPWNLHMYICLGMDPTWWAPDASLHETICVSLSDYKLWVSKTHLSYSRSCQWTWKQWFCFCGIYRYIFNDTLSNGGASNKISRIPRFDFPKCTIRI